MRLSASIIPRFYAPLKTLTRQSPRLSPALTAVNATTTTTTTTPFTLNNMMSTSSASQSSFPSSSSTRKTAADGAAKTEPTEAAANNHHQQRQIPSEESHRQHHPTESTSPAPENATSNAPAGEDNAFSTPDSTHGQPLALPPLPEAPSSSSAGGGDSAGGGAGGNNSNTITLDLGGQPGGGASTKLDHLGPLVVNQDGTMSRISNWGEMAEIERQNTLRILGRRNQIRLASLRDGAGGEGKQQ